MRRGVWHQFGDRSQKLAVEQLERGAGVGVILSPRDLARNAAIRYAGEYHRLGAHVLVDQQFYEPSFTNSRLDSYPISRYRTTVSDLCQIRDRDLMGLSDELKALHQDLSADGVVAPALAYEAGRPDIVQLNARLFAAAKLAGDELSIPTYATVMLGQSAVSSSETVDAALSYATALDSDGWYYGFEFAPGRIPSSPGAVLRCCAAGLTLACTGKPVLHAYSGPMALLSMGFGATAAAIGHFQNLWRFARARWQASVGGGGGGDAPARFFSTALWGTIVYPDEVNRLPQAVRGRVLTHSPFSAPIAGSSPLPWSRWDANKHLVNAICSTVTHIAVATDARGVANAAIRVLQGAVDLHAGITSAGIDLADNTNAYQANWLHAMQDLLRDHAKDYDYLRLIQ